ncbi:30S ribosomal protein S8 [Candidatus Synchoanobacter obligatus]|uniref:Small ribosomal subunit protein uS8 n=1 Tax=Candidatus Synchoanobacter obligatus TaxID=2919597 RepID=A0ABT1L7B0_9GAMM|nr:30S ribosomal protein S8 [Candidatus Synchoanobacter obligatus]MCP8352500.1 30S ribosomal protein S8 [Candidatus Synchoanobacter obligatus]
MLQYEIADCLTRIRNAYLRGQSKTKVRKTKFNASVLAVLKEQGSIKGYENGQGDDKYFIVVSLMYINRRPSLRSVKVCSRPGLRVYHACDKIPTFKSGLAYGVMSTSKGMMTTHQAKSAGVGGELVCVVE